MNIYNAVFERSRVGHTGSSLAAIVLGNYERSLTYSQLKDVIDTNRAATSVQPGEKIALVMPNSLELVIGLFTIWAQGAAAAPLNPAYTAVEFRASIEDLGITTVFIMPGDDKIRAALTEASTALTIVEMHCEASKQEVTVPLANESNNIALYLHTSGTTGKPKAVPLRHANLVRGAKNVAETYDLDESYRTYVLMVLFHIHGIVAALLGPLTTGGSIVIPPGGILDASRAWRDFTEQQCNWVTATPSILQTLLAAPCDGPLPKIRFLRSCSSPLLPTVFEALRKRFCCPVLEAYAMTEASHQMCSNKPQYFAAGTVGTEAGSTKVFIFDGSVACQPGVEGEVCVSGENVMDGYEGVNAETQKTAFWQGSDDRGIEANWFRTGDRGFMSTDGQRRITLVGRNSEMINRGGEKISPVEVDEALMLANEDVKEAASFGVSDKFYGQEIEAAVVLRPGSALHEEKLQQLLEQRLSLFKVPKRIHFCKDKIPKGPTGKIQRKNLSQQFGAVETKSVSSHSTVSVVHTVVEKALRLPKGHAGRNASVSLLELGADSLTLAKIVAGVKRQTGKILPMASLLSFPSIDAIIRMTDEQPPQEGNVNNGAAGTTSKPAAFSLLPVETCGIECLCRQAKIAIDDLEDAHPLSSSQAMFFDIVLGPRRDNEFLWQLSRYDIAENVDPDSLCQALILLQAHEESLRWTLVEDAKLGWVTLQCKPGVENRVERIQCETETEAINLLDDRLAASRHTSGAKTAILFVLEIGSSLELAILESHACTEGQGRRQMLEVLSQAYHGQELDTYNSYSLFVERNPPGEDSRENLSFWRNEKAAIQHSEGPNWEHKEQTLLTPRHRFHDRLDLAGARNFAEGPFDKLVMETGVTLPCVVEAVFSISIALYLSQQDRVFSSGFVAYDRRTSLRSTDERFTGLRAVTGVYQPNFMSLDHARTSIWSYLQYFRAMTTLREQKMCMNSVADIANHAVAFSWRFKDDAERETPEASATQLVIGEKAAKFTMQAAKMCFVSANRKGNTGVNIGIGFHREWLQDRRDQGAKIELIDVYLRSLEFCARNYSKLTSISLSDVERAALGGA